MSWSIGLGDRLLKLSSKRREISSLFAGPLLHLPPSAETELSSGYTPVSSLRPPSD